MFNVLGVVMDFLYIDVISRKILNEILQYRRRFNLSSMTLEEEEEIILKVHLPRVKAFLIQSKPIMFILPAFPTKSPNSKKVLGKLPDMAEKLSLVFLNSLCERIKVYYPPGAEMIICSDGHVFGELIGVCDGIIDDYQDKLNRLLCELELNYISIFNLSHVEEFNTSNNCYNHSRKLLVEKYSLAIGVIKKQLTGSEDGLSLYRAITRFLYEDSLLPNYSGSKNALQKNARQRAVGVIQHSWAWGNLLAQQFPSAIRLSIHPQPVSSLKIGIHMMPTCDNLLTPWHGVAVQINGKFILMKRSEAEEMDGKLIKINEEPSHYII